MELEEILGTILSGPMLAAVCIVIYLHRQENQSLHQSIDNNTAALKELTKLINDMRVTQAETEQQITELWHRYKDLKGEVAEVRKCQCKAAGKSVEQD